MTNWVENIKIFLFFSPLPVVVVSESRKSVEVAPKNMARTQFTHLQAFSEMDLGILSCVPLLLL